MIPLAVQIETMLPELRRYALALTGDRYSGDWYVGVVLESLVERQPALSPECDVRTELYRLLGQAVKLDWPGVLDGTDEPDAEDGEPEAALRRRILCLPLFTRQVLLLVALGGFSTEQAGAICGLTAAQAEAHLATARNTCRVSQARRIPKPSRVDALPRHARAAASSIGPDLPSTAVLGRVAA